MIITSKEMREETRQNMRGGKGEISILHLAEPEEVCHGRLLSRISIPPGAGIGPHQHQEETEYYIIISGEGSVQEDDGMKQVSAGDLVVTGNGATHSIENSGEILLELIAVIIQQ